MIAHHASPHQVTRINSHNSTGVHLHSCLFFMVLKKNENCYILELFLQVQYPGTSQVIEKVPLH